MAIGHIYHEEKNQAIREYFIGLKNNHKDHNHTNKESLLFCQKNDKKTKHRLQNSMSDGICNLFSRL